MTISAKIIADSKSRAGARILTLELYYPRFIHAEFMTHRVFSRNASSSRAIPVETMIQSIIDDTAMPIHWGANQKGMQANTELPEMEKAEARAIWMRARDNAITEARAMIRLGAHKQIVNRLLEPFAHIRVVVTATEWNNFFALRLHPDAQPEIQALAQTMYDAIVESYPVIRGEGDWHLPYVTDEEREFVEVEALLKVSTARCARVSYRLHDGTASSMDRDLQLYDQLVGSQPAHASPCEHQARPHLDRNKDSRNFTGWQQYRAILNV